MSYYRAEVSKCYPFFVMLIFIVYCWCFCFLVVSFFLRLFMICVGYPLFFVFHSSFFRFFCGGECYHSIYIVSECCNLVLMWMVRGKLDCCISTCSFPVDTYVHVVITSMYGNVQLICCIAFLSRHLKLKVFVYLIDFM